jgi:hypothetical protein
MQINNSFSTTIANQVWSTTIRNLTALGSGVLFLGQATATLAAAATIDLRPGSASKMREITCIIQAPLTSGSSRIALYDGTTFMGGWQATNAGTTTQVGLSGPGNSVIGFAMQNSGTGTALYAYSFADWQI